MDKNYAKIEPFICTPYVGSPIFYNNKDKILEQYDYRLSFVNNDTFKIDEDIVNKLKLSRLIEIY